MGALQGVTICPNALTIHHLLFVDDCLIFTKARREDCEMAKALLRFYDRALGQVVNFQKSAVCFAIT